MIYMIKWLIDFKVGFVEIKNEITLLYHLDF